MDGGASIIAFVTIAAQLTKCIIEARDLWEQVKNVPEEIKDLLGDLELLGHTFRAIKDEYNKGELPQDFWDTSSAKQIVNVSIRAHKSLEDAIRELKSQLETKKGLRRKVSAVKFVIRRDVLEKLEKRLGRSLELLRTSMQLYSIALARQSPGIIAKKVTVEVVAQLNRPCEPRLAVQEHGIYTNNPKSNVPDTEDYTLIKPKRFSQHSAPRSSRFALAHTESTRRWQARIRLPLWLSRAVYEIHASSTYAGWTYNFRSYNVISFDSDVIKMVELGDTAGVLELFKSRRASPFDRDENSNSLLYHATKPQQYDMCRLLLEMGLEELLDEPIGSSKNSPLSVLALKNRHVQNASPEVSRIIDLFRSYFQEPDSIPIDRLFDFVREYAFDDSHVLAFRDMFIPKYFSLPLRDRLEAVRLGALIVKTPMTLHGLLSRDRTITSFDVHMSTCEKLSLVHSAAVALGSRFADELIPHKRPHCYMGPYFEAWSDYVTNVATVSSAEDMHSIESVSVWNDYQVPVWRGTPLTSLIGGALCFVSSHITMAHWDSILQGTLQRWLEEIHTAGIDLAEYGRREKYILHDESDSFKGAFDADAIEQSRHTIRHSLAQPSKPTKFGRGDTRESQDINYWIPIRILDLLTGPNPSDWRVVWAAEFEYMACQFWEMVERSSIVMPGSWID